MLSDKAFNLVAYVVLTVWVLNFTASLIPGLNYESDQTVNGIFLTIMGIAFTGRATSKDKDRQ